jgi:transcriptional regulator with XRE-family HTH domain
MPPPEILSRFGEAVRRQREKLQMSQQTAAESAGLSISYWGKIERAQVNVSLGNVDKISAALKCHPIDLLRDYKIPASLLAAAAQTVVRKKKR